MTSNDELRQQLLELEYGLLTEEAASALRRAHCPGAGSIRVTRAKRRMRPCFSRLRRTTMNSLFASPPAKRRLLMMPPMRSRCIAPLRSERMSSRDEQLGSLDGAWD